MIVGSSYDLISRTAGFLGVIGALLVIPYLFELPIEPAIASSHQAVSLTIQVTEPQEQPHTESIEESLTEIKPEPQPQPAAREPVRENVKEGIKEAPSPKAVLSVPEPSEPPLKAPEPKKVEQLVPKPKMPAKKKPQPKQPPKAERQEPLTKPQENVRPSREAPARTATRAQTKPPAGTYQSAAAAQERQLDLRQQISAAQQNLGSLIKKTSEYPRQARRRGLEGEILISFVIEDGKVSAFTILKPSGRALLDKAAQKTAQELVGQQVSPFGSFELEVPIIYRLVEN